MSSSPPSPPRRGGTLDRSDAEATRTLECLHWALAYTGRVGDGQVCCPGCNEWAPLKGKFKMFADGGFKHFSSQGCHGDPISVLTGAPLNLRFPDAVNALLGRPTSVDLPPAPKNLPKLEYKTFTATLDTEVYNGVLAYGRKALGGAGVTAAQEFYAQWHISPQVVEEYGAVYITDPKHFAANILARFGPERLIACGLFVEGKNGDPYCLVSDKWPVIEPHRHPQTGEVLNIQFRASNAQYAKYLEHKAGRAPYEGNQKFINLRGIPSGAYIGAGLDRIELLPPGSTIYIVEGFKDMLAARTSGAYAYGIPGVDFRPPPKVCALLARHKVVLSLDGDAAGAAGIYGTVEIDRVRDGKPVRVPANRVPRGAKVTKVHSQGLLAYLREHGVNDVFVYDIPGGLDVTDRLVQKHADAGCACPACVAFRAAHPAGIPA